MKPLRSEIQFLAYLINTKELSMEGIVLFLKHAGYRVRYSHPPTIQEKDIALSDMQQRDE